MCTIRFGLIVLHEIALAVTYTISNNSATRNMNIHVKQFIKGKFIVNSSRKYLEDFARHAAESVPERGRVLDAGAGDCPYKHYFGHTKYETADFCKVDKPYGTIDYVCDLTCVPVEDKRYDLVLLTQVLEHIPEPMNVLKEMHRILKPGGCLWLSAPLFYEEHETPNDYYRYTQFGLKYMLNKTGYSIKKIYWLEGYYGTISYQLLLAARSLPLHSNKYGGGIIGVLCLLLAVNLKVLFGMLSIVFSKMDLRYKFSCHGLCKNYCVVAVKE